MAKHNWWLVLLFVSALENTGFSQTTNVNPTHTLTEETLSLSTDLPQTYNLSVIDEIHHESVSMSAPIITRKIRIDIPIESTEYTTITSENYPQPYPDTAFNVEWTIGFGSGYGVEVIIRDLELDGDTQDYVLIRPGGLDIATEDELVFSWFLKEERKYRLIHLNELYIKFQAFKKTGNKNKGFKIDVKQIGELPTTTSSPSTEEPPVTVQPKQEASIYLKGIAPTGFLNISQSFKNNLAIIAEKYCSENNITVDNLTILDNVNYHQIGSCFYNWPDYEKCVHIIYSIPVHFDNETEAYELTTEHLDDMWLRYSDFMNLASFDLEVYPFPDDIHIFNIWVGISVESYYSFCLYSPGSGKIIVLLNLKVEPGEMNHRNLGFSQDTQLYDLDSDEEIIMSLPETHVKDQTTLRMSGGGQDSNESNL